MFCDLIVQFFSFDGPSSKVPSVLSSQPYTQEPLIKSPKLYKLTTRGVDSEAVQLRRLAKKPGPHMVRA